MSNTLRSLGSKWYVTTSRDEDCSIIDIHLRNEVMKTQTGDYDYNNNVITVKDDKIEYFIQNPSIAEYSAYEQALYNVCNTFKLEIIMKEDNTIAKCMTDIVYEIETKSLSCDLLANLSIVSYNKKCDISIDLSEQECIFAYNEVCKEHGCNLSIGEYKHLLSLGFTPESISTIYQQQYQLTPDGNKLFNNLGVGFDLKSELCFTDISTTGIGDVQAFLEKALVGLPEDLINEIINSHV